MKEVLTHFPWLSLSSAGLLIFFAFFVALLVIVNLKPQQKIYKAAALLPLEDGDSTQELQNVGR